MANPRIRKSWFAKSDREQAWEYRSNPRLAGEWSGSDNPCDLAIGTGERFACRGTTETREHGTVPLASAAHRCPPHFGGSRRVDHAFEPVLWFTQQQQLTEYEAAYLKLALRARASPLATLDNRIKRVKARRQECRSLWLKS